MKTLNGIRSRALVEIHCVVRWIWMVRTFGKQMLFWPYFFVSGSQNRDFASSQKTRHIHAINCKWLLNTFTSARWRPEGLVKAPSALLTLITYVSTSNSTSRVMSCKGGIRFCVEKQECVTLLKWGVNNGKGIKISRSFDTKSPQHPITATATATYDCTGSQVFTPNPSRESD